MYGLRDLAEKDLEGTLAAVREAGYDGIELAGLYGRTPDELKNLFAQYSLKPISAHIPYLELVNDMHQTLAAYKQLGCTYVAVPVIWPVEDWYPGAGWQNVAPNLIKIGAAAKECGLTLLYHNHDYEFRTMPNGRYVLDDLYDTVSSELLKTELDICWVKVAGADPIAYIRQYAGRRPLIHFKDFHMEGHPVAYYGPDFAKLNEGKGVFEYRAVGAGDQNWPPILDELRNSDTEWIVVEQDESRDALADMEASIQYIRSIM